VFYILYSVKYPQYTFEIPLFTEMLTDSFFHTFHVPTTLIVAA
jgi:hypothetical protein